MEEAYGYEYDEQPDYKKLIYLLQQVLLDIEIIPG